MIKESHSERLDLGKKISVPRDVMMEELNLLSNRASRMFHERLKRTEKFTLENARGTPSNISHLSTRGTNLTNVHPGLGQTKGSQDEPGGEENFCTGLIISQSGRDNFASTLKSTVAKKGSPQVLAPGYSGPLKAMPHEKFNFTVIPKCYCSPWREDQSGSDKLLVTINARLPEPPQKLVPANYKCFNRAPIPFGGTAGSMMILPLPGFELSQAHTEPSMTWESISKRPNFNRVPQGWGIHCSIETTDL